MYMDETNKEAKYSPLTHTGPYVIHIQKNPRKPWAFILS